MANGKPGTRQIAVVAFLVFLAALAGFFGRASREEDPTSRPLQASAQLATAPADHRLAEPTGAGVAAHAPVAIIAPSTSAFLPDLRRAADAGDATAACQLAFELNGCAEIAKLEAGDTVGTGLQDAPDHPLATVVNEQQRCAAATESDLRDRYRYHALAFASGDASTERAFIQNPLLDEDDFLVNSPNAVDFRQRGQLYIDRALRRHDTEDLKLLLQIYAPSGYGRTLSRLRVRDDAMFVALADAARSAGVLDEHMAAIATRVRRVTPPHELQAASSRVRSVAGSWRPTAPSNPETQDRAVCPPERRAG